MIVGAVLIALIAYHFMLPPTLDATLGGPTLARVLVAVGTTAPVAFLMGMPFPLGFRRIGLESPNTAAWAWAVNAGASVSGSVVAVLLSMSFGFGAALLGGIAAYALSFVMAATLRPPGARAST